EGRDRPSEFSVTCSCEYVGMIEWFVGVVKLQRKERRAFDLTRRHEADTTRCARCAIPNQIAAMKESHQPKYRRILLKLSGEALGGENGMGIRPEAVQDMAEQIR